MMSVSRCFGHSGKARRISGPNSGRRTSGHPALRGDRTRCIRLRWVGDGGVKPSRHRLPYCESSKTAHHNPGVRVTSTREPRRATRGGRLSAAARCSERTTRRSGRSPSRGRRGYRNRGKGIARLGAATREELRGAPRPCTPGCGRTRKRPESRAARFCICESPATAESSDCPVFVKPAVRSMTGGACFSIRGSSRWFSAWRIGGRRSEIADRRTRRL